MSVIRSAITVRAFFTAILLLLSLVFSGTGEGERAREASTESSGTEWFGGTQDHDLDEPGSGLHGAAALPPSLGQIALRAPARECMQRAVGARALTAQFLPRGREPPRA